MDTKEQKLFDLNRRLQELYNRRANQPARADDGDVFGAAASNNPFGDSDQDEPEPERKDSGRILLDELESHGVSFSAAAVKDDVANGAQETQDRDADGFVSSERASQLIDKLGYDEGLKIIREFLSS